MEFRFDINKIFKNNISRIGNALLPAGFVATDRRVALDTTAFVAEIINTIGQASATAQGLSTPVTSAHRLRNADDQVIYLMTENEKNGVVVGLLKIGRKSLYVFDKLGETRHVNSPCVLDFYIHESRQRAGLGKILFEYMLEYENLLPEQLAIDRPSEKLLAFLRKHYALTEKIPQMNNFVIYEGFFAALQSQRDELNASGQMHITASPNSNLFGPQFVNEDHRRRSQSQNRQEPVAVQSNVLGRYGANRPKCSLNQIIHNKPTTVTTEPSSTPVHVTFDAHIDNVSVGEVESLAQEVESLDVGSNDDAQTPSPVPSAKDEADAAQEMQEMHQYEDHEEKYYNHADDMHQDSQHREFFVNPRNRSYSPFQYNKRQTGKKNISSIVVGDDDKMEFEQKEDRGFGVIKINRPIGEPRSSYENMNDTESNHSEQTHTADGFFDLKFYSHPLW